MKRPTLSIIVCAAGAGSRAGFDKNKMDCSSLAQYVMHQGAGVNIGMNTATTIHLAS